MDPLDLSPVLRVSGLSHRYPGRDVDTVHDVSVSLDRGAVLAVLGPSGCGKSTLLRLLAGLLQPSTGTVNVQGGVAMVFQDPRLLPWMSVAGNLDFALEAAGVAASERRDRWAPLLTASGLEGTETLMPSSLSGGMAQRVGVVRALALQPALLLLDEPFGAVDPLLREEFQEMLGALLVERGSAAVLVTHDVQEAAVLADSVMVLSGRPAGVRAVHTIGEARPRPASFPWSEAGAACVRKLRASLR